MTIIYFKDADGQKVSVEVTDEVAAVDLDTRRTAWRNDAKEKYYRDKKSGNLNDHDEELTAKDSDPSEKLIADEDRLDQRAKLSAALKTLSPAQIDLVRMLKSGMSVTAIADKLDIDKSAVSHRRKRIQEKIKKFLI